ncbi:MAG: T9SS type A sorting domain-containing protein [Ignavibacteria bacterium]|nr:T9SS type A sorting domain-containing protein [Ignavibacteria bacterium]
MYTWTFTNHTLTPTVIGDGNKTIIVTATDPFLNVGTGSDNIGLDNTPPETPASALKAHPKHMQVDLDWTTGSVSSGSPLFGYMMKQNVSSDYPLYDAVSPGYPVPAVGVFNPPYVTADFILDPAVTYTFVPSPYTLVRGIWYFQMYTYDYALNKATSGSDMEKATDYYLGDFLKSPLSAPALPPTSGDFDGYVNFDDMAWFGSVYWEGLDAVALSPVEAVADIAKLGGGATERTYLVGDPFGIPETDNMVEFEDLMIVSLNYGMVGPKAPAPVNATISKDFALNLQQKASGNELAVTVQLENNGMSVKGASVTLSYNPEVLRVRDVTDGSLFGEPGVSSFFAHVEQNNSVRVDAAMLGTGRTVEYSGDIATLRFEVIGAGDPGLVFGTARLRDGENKNIVARLKSTSADAPQGFALSQNFPNPFTPATTIAYQVAENTTVTIDVFNALGAKVATIANGPHDAGSYQAQLDASGLPSGLYYYTMRAGSFTATRSMTIVK